MGVITAFTIETASPHFLFDVERLTLDSRICLQSTNPLNQF